MESSECNNHCTDLTINNKSDQLEQHSKVKELSLTDQIRMLSAELIGTALLVFFGCMGCIDWFNLKALYIPASINFGLTVLFVVHIFGHISYAIINPAVVITAYVFKILDLKLAIFYVIAEIIGAILGYGVLYAVTPEEFFRKSDGPSLCITNINPSISIGQGFVIEFFVTSVLIFTVCSVWDPRNKDKSSSASIVIGLTVATLCIAAAPITVASMNPARSIGPAIWNWEWENHWMYWVSSLSASLITSISYRIIFWKDPEIKL